MGKQISQNAVIKPIAVRLPSLYQILRLDATAIAQFHIAGLLLIICIINHYLNENILEFLY